MSKTKWLHISDFHFGIETADVMTIRNDLMEFVKGKDIDDIKYLFISGDIFFAKRFFEHKDKSKLLTKAKKFVKDIALALEIGNDNIFIVPGNHDVFRGTGSEFEENESKEYYESKKYRETYINSIKTKNKIEDEDLNKLTKWQEDYINFCESLSEANESKVNYCRKAHELIIKDDINVLLVNTALTTIDSRDDKGELLLGAEYFAEELDKHKDKEKPLVILAHHSPHCFSEADRGYIKTIKEKNELDLLLILCGHEHRSDSNDYFGIKMFVCGAQVLFDEKKGDFRILNDVIVLTGEIDKGLRKVTIKSYKWTYKRPDNKSAWIPNRDIGNTEPYNEVVFYYPEDCNDILKKILEESTIKSERETKIAIREYLREKIDTLKKNKGRKTDKIKDIATELKDIIKIVVEHRSYWQSIKELDSVLCSPIRNAETLEEIQNIVAESYRQDEEARKAINKKVPKVFESEDEKGILLYSKSTQVIDFLKDIELEMKKKCTIYVCAGSAKSKLYAYQDAYDIEYELYDDMALNHSGYKEIQFIPDMSFDSYMKDGKINIILLGAHKIFHDGKMFTEFENTIGSGLIIERSQKYNIPCYIIASSTKFEKKEQYDKSDKLETIQPKDLDKAITIKYLRLEVYDIGDSIIISDKESNEYFNEQSVTH